MGYLLLRELSPRRPARIDWPGNITFALGLILIMVGITYGIEPYGRHAMGWTNPVVLTCLLVGVVLLVVFGIIETRVEEPMFRLQLFKIRAFSAGLFASLLAALSRGGLMFMLIIWLQGIWLPLHGYTFERTPLWAGIAILPLTAGLLIAGPISGILSDRFGARIFASGGMIGTAICFLLLEFLPVDFPYPLFAVLLFFTGLSMASFGSPNRAAVMSSCPAEYRGVGSGMNTTFQNSAQVLSIGIFFSLMIFGLSASLPAEPLPRAGGARRAEWSSPPSVPAAAGLDALRCAARLQPDSASRWAACPGAVASGPAGDTDRPELLPFPHCGAVQIGPPCRVRLRHRGQSSGRRRFVDPRRRTRRMPRTPRVAVATIDNEKARSAETNPESVSEPAGV